MSSQNRSFYGENSDDILCVNLASFDNGQSVVKFYDTPSVWPYFQ
jgi:hypothetical protein